MIDQEHLARQTAGDTDLQRELLTLFLEQLTDMRDDLSASRSQSARLPGVDLQAALHRLSGAAAAVGAQGLVRSFSQAEQALDRNPSSPAALDALRAELKRACTTLAGLIAARVPAGLAKGGESR